MPAQRRGAGKEKGKIRMVRFEEKNYEFVVVGGGIIKSTEGDCHEI